MNPQEQELFDALCIVSAEPFSYSGDEDYLSKIVDIGLVEYKTLWRLTQLGSNIFEMMKATYRNANC